jgi:hypothetical protein
VLTLLIFITKPLTFHEILIPVLTTTMPIILLFTTRLLAKTKAESSGTSPEVMTIVTEFPDFKLRVALLEDRVRNLINGKYERK